MQIWCNGEFGQSTCQVSVADRGFLLGDGLFETIALENGRPIFMHAHLARLKTGLEALNMPPQGAKNLAEIIVQLARMNEITDKGVARITISRGIGGRGLAPANIEDATPTVVVTATPWRAKIPEPIRLAIAESRRYSEAVHSAFKHVSDYARNISALTEAHAMGVDDAIMLNERNEIACATAANIFIVRPTGELLTPPLSSGALNGVVRSVVLNSASRFGLAPREAVLTALDINGAEIVLTNSLIGIRRAVLVGDQENEQVGNLAASEFCDRLQSCYDASLKSDQSGNLKGIAG